MLLFTVNKVYYKRVCPKQSIFHSQQESKCVSECKKDISEGNKHGMCRKQPHTWVILLGHTQTFHNRQAEISEKQQDDPLTHLWFALNVPWWSVYSLLVCPIPLVMVSQRLKPSCPVHWPQNSTCRTDGSKLVPNQFPIRCKKKILKRTIYNLMSAPLIPRVFFFHGLIKV